MNLDFGRLQNVITALDPDLTELNDDSMTGWG